MTVNSANMLRIIDVGEGELDLFGLGVVLVLEVKALIFSILGLLFCALVLERLVLYGWVVDVGGF